MGHIGWLAAALLLGQTSWQSYSSKEDGFTALFPGTVTKRQQTATGPDGKLEGRGFVCEVKGGGAYLVSVTEYPDSTAAGSPERRLTNARNGAVDSVKGKLLHERKIKLGDVPGRELWIESERAGLIHTRIYAAGPRLCQTLVIGPKDFVETKDAARFLDSFRVIK